MEEKENTRKIRIMIADDFPLLVEDLCELIERQEDMEVRSEERRVGKEC